MYRLTDTVKHLIIINIIMFIGTLAIGNGTLFYDWFALHFPKSEIFKGWQPVTHMFMHGGFMHILFNMFALWMFGTTVEQFFGGKKFLFFYISCGLGAMLLQTGYYYFEYSSLQSSIEGLGMSSDLVKQIVNIDARQGQGISGQLFLDKLNTVLSNNNFDHSLITQNAFDSLFNMNAINHTTMVGASGAIMGVLVAFGMLQPEARLMLIFLPIPIKAKYFIPGIIILDLISAVTGQSFFSPSNTAYVAHLGGALTGFLMMWFWKKQQFNQNRWDR